MNSLLLKTFLPESFLSLWFLLQIVLNLRFIYYFFVNFPIILQENLVQTFLLLFCLSFLYTTIKIEFISETFLFLNTFNEYLLKFILVSFLFFILSSFSRSFLNQSLNFFEFFVIVLICLLSFLLIISCFDLIFFYLTIELQALCFYIMSSFKRNSTFTTEAGLKYFITGALTSSFFLLGCSLIYICVGTLSLDLINITLYFFLKNEFYSLVFYIILSTVLILTVFLFKLSVAPFHFWSPDVYEGAPLSSTLIFSLLPKLVWFSILIKWILVMSTLFLFIKSFLVFCGFFSIFLGTFFSIYQKRIKRMLIYSSITQIGFLIFALTINNFEGYTTIYFYLFIYLLSSFLVWSNVVMYYSFQNETLSFQKYKINPFFLSNLSKSFEIDNLLSTNLVLVFFSFAGIPPLSGFLTKYLVLCGVFQKNDFVIVTILILISVISTFYYIRIIKILFFSKNKLIIQNVKFQTVFSLFLIEFDFLNSVFGLLVLLLSFFYPTLIFLVSQKLAFSYLI